MSNCDLIYACSFYKRGVDSGTSLGVLYQKAYCSKDWENCARYRIAKALGLTKVPADLYPNMSERAREILSSPSEPSSDHIADSLDS